jgi:hypothetical protein
MSESRIGVSPTRNFLSDTVLDTTNCAYSHAIFRRSSGVEVSIVHEPVSW